MLNTYNRFPVMRFQSFAGELLRHRPAATASNAPPLRHHSCNRVVIIVLLRAVNWTAAETRRLADSYGLAYMAAKNVIGILAY